MDTSAGAVDASTLPEGRSDFEPRLPPLSVVCRARAEEEHGDCPEGARPWAMTGDGINDALALLSVAIAMGNAAPATKAVSRLVPFWTVVLVPAGCVGAGPSGHYEQ